MVKHIVCFKLANPTEAAMNRAREVLLSMIGNVPTIREIEVGLDFLRSPRAFDIHLSVLVDDRDALTEYANDPYHCNVVKTHMHAVCEKSVTVDFEI